MLRDFGGIVVVENYSFLDLVSVACWTRFFFGSVAFMTNFFKTEHLESR